MSNELQTAHATGYTVYAHVLSTPGYRWNTVDEELEAYQSANYADYDIAMVEQGSSGVFLGNFPTALTQSGHYNIFYYRQIGGSPAEGDPVIGTGEIQWNGSAEVSAGQPNSMTGIQWLAYLKRAFKRTDKDAEIYEATTDVVRDMRMKVPMLEDEITKQTLDAITTLGDYKLDLEPDNNRLLGSIVVRDGTNSRQLNKISKEEFDRRYPNPDASNVTKSLPEDFCVSGNEIYIGPVPDKTTYEYWINYLQDDLETIDEDTTAVPYSNRYRLYLKWGVLAVLYADLKNNEEAGKNGTLYDNALREVIEPRENANRDSDGYVENCDVA